MLLALLLGATSGRADLILTVTPISTTETSTSFTGSFEIDISNPASGTDTSVNSFSLTLQLNPSLGIQFTGVSTSTTTDAYIFNGIGGEAAFGAYDPVTNPTGFLFSNDSFPTTQFAAGDNDWLGSTPPPGTGLPAVDLAPAGASYGLALVTFSASNATAGTAFINLLTNGTTSYSDTDGTTYTLTGAPGSGLDYPNPGTITVATSIIPEPSTVPVIVAVGTMGLVAGWARRRRRGSLLAG
jgi:hypothetical protein